MSRFRQFWVGLTERRASGAERASTSRLLGLQDEYLFKPDYCLSFNTFRFLFLSF